jgi:hypothetical protein
VYALSNCVWIRYIKKARRYALGFSWSGWRDYYMISGGWPQKKPIAVARLFGFFYVCSLKLRLDSLHKKSPTLRVGLFLVGMARFELTTPCTPCKCATGLRYIPIFVRWLPNKIPVNGRMGTGHP